MNEDIRLRRATQQDREALCEVQRLAILTLGRSHYSEAAVEAWASGLTPEGFEKAIAEDYVVVAERGARVVGFGRLGSSGEIGAVYVRPEFARRGIGGAILGELISEARRRWLREVHCESSLRAEGFNAQAGFESGERCKHRFRDGREIDCIPMKKAID